jgi:zinc protease
MVNRSIPPGFKIPEQVAFTQPIKRTLNNGVPLYFISTPQLDVVKVEVIMPINHQVYSPDQGLVPFFTLNMLLEGTHEHSSDALDDFFDYYATEVEIVSGYEQQGLSLLTTKKHFREVLPMFRSLFTEATFPEKELAKRKSQKKLTIAIQQEQTGARANQLIRKTLFGELHPFGYISDEMHVDAITREDIKSYYRSNFCIAPELFVTGNLTDREMQEIENQFNNLPFQETNGMSPDFSTFRGKRVYEERPKSLQSSIRLGKILIPKSHPDYYALMVFNTTLGGYFGSRLIKNIREEKGYTYGISSYMGSLKSTDYWMILADVKKGTADAAIAEVYKEIRLLTEKPLEREELETVRNYMIGHFLSQFSNPFDLMGRFKKIHLQGLGYEYYENQLEFIKTFDPIDILHIGKTYFQEDSIKEIIVGA